jgi:hypothetical protein
MKMHFVRMFLFFLMLLIAVPGTLDQINAAQASKSSKVVEKAPKNPVQTQHQFADDQVNVFYCTSCGFHQNFLQVKEFLIDKYPHLVDRVYGANLEPQPIKKVRIPSDFFVRSLESAHAFYLLASCSIIGLYSIRLYPNNDYGRICKFIRV